MGWWKSDQDMKPDAAITLTPRYYYSSTVGFYRMPGFGTNSASILSFPANTYEIFAYGDPAWSFALGAQPNVAAAFFTSQQIDLDAIPYSFGPDHKGHSAQFRSDNMNRAVFWIALFNRMRLSP